ncbi:MAG TPA: hypothetical protein VHU88_15225 [Sporichthyaceae bacterium]|nr:hypothetical protein [Sporichthyaceae bacterium]
MREATEHDYEDSGMVGAARAGARIVVMSLMVTALVAGGYLMINGRGGAAAQVTTPDSSAAVAPPAPTPTPSAAAKPTFADKVASAIAALPPGSLSSTQKHTALVAYDKALGFDFGAGGSPATAASTACSLLAGGTKPADLVSGVEDGASLTAAQSRAFLLGASTLYCSKYASNFS